MADYKTIIKELKLQSHPEGGFFTETYRSDLLIPKEGLPDHYDGARNASTAIYFLLTEDQPISRLHQLKSDEMFHLYDGGPLEVLLLEEDGSGRIAILGRDLEDEQRPQLLISKGTWFGAKLQKGVPHALIGCTVSPGFDFKDFKMDVNPSMAEALKRKYDDFSTQIDALLPG